MHEGFLLAFFHADHWFIPTLALCILAIGLFQHIIHVLQLPAAWMELKQHAQTGDNESPWRLLLSKTGTPISVLVPAFNEQSSIVNNIRALLSLKYASFELIVVNDGSTDATLDTLINAFNLKPIFRAHELRLAHKPVRGIYGSPYHPNLFIIDKENGGNKADALNAGINFSRNPLFCVIDADSILDPDALLRTVRPFMEDPDHMIAVGGTVRILNGCEVRGGQIKKISISRQPVILLQTLEYVRSFLVARLAWSRWRMLTIVSGAFGIFSRRVAIEVGGFSLDTVGEDYDLIIKMHRHMINAQQPYKMRYIPEPVCWTRTPQSLTTLGAQRRRWQRGALEVFFKNLDIFVNPRYGKIGMFSFSIHFVTDILGPLAELLCYLLIPLAWACGALDGSYLLAFVAIHFLFGTFISLCALILEEIELHRYTDPRDLCLLGVAAIAENFGYRQINNYWRIMGWIDYISGRKDWGERDPQTAPSPKPA